MFKENDMEDWEKEVKEHVDRLKGLEEKAIKEEIPKDSFEGIEYVIFNIDFRRFGDSNDKSCRIEKSKHHYYKKKWYYDLIEVESIKNPIETGRKFEKIPQENLIDPLELKRY